jgi:hypothetical protein
MIHSKFRRKFAALFALGEIPFQARSKLYFIHF